MHECTYDMSELETTLQLMTHLFIFGRDVENALWLPLSADARHHVRRRIRRPNYLCSEGIAQRIRRGQPACAGNICAVFSLQGLCGCLLAAFVPFSLKYLYAYIPNPVRNFW
jgi:hypothetical protein